MSEVNVWTQATTTAVKDALVKILNFLPNVIGAVLVVIVGVVVAVVLKKAIVELFKILKVEELSERSGLAATLRRAGIETTVTSVVATLVKWITIIVFILPAAEIVNLSQVSQLVYSVLSYVPNVVVAVIILFFGSLLADFVASLVRGSAALLKVKTVKLLSGIARYSIIIFSILAALNQLKIASELIQTLWTGIVALIAIAGGIAFGLGSKDVASKIIEDFYHKYFK